MTIPLKFRVWDVKHNHFYYRGEGEELWHFIRCHNSEDVPHLISSQSIGKYDMNEKEIYYGDIMKIGENLAVVKYDNICARYYFDVIKNVDWCDDWGFEDCYRMEVVDTIYERTASIINIEGATQEQINAFKIAVEKLDNL